VRKTAGVIGYPIDHSRSPAIHQAAYAAAGVDAVYLPFAVKPARLAEAIAGVRALDFIGVNVTVPHKQAALALVDEADDVARATGAVNTIVCVKGRLVGTNTDVEGFRRSLADERVAPAEVVVLGAGGAARAVVAALAGRARRITIAARDPEKAAPLAAIGATEIVSWGHAEEVLERAELLVDATSMALVPDDDVPISIDRLPGEAAVCSLVYHREPRLLAAARARGLAAFDGAGMLVHQAARAFTLMTGREAPLEVMRAAFQRDQAS
jgi:shikimate dehydrogenase